MRTSGKWRKEGPRDREEGEKVANSEDEEAEEEGCEGRDLWSMK